MISYDVMCHFAICPAIHIAISLLISVSWCPQLLNWIFVAICGVPSFSASLLTLYMVFPLCQLHFCRYIQCSHCLNCIFVAIHGVPTVSTAFLSLYVCVYIIYGVRSTVSATFLSLSHCLSCISVAVHGVPTVSTASSFSASFSSLEASGGSFLSNSGACSPNGSQEASGGSF